MLDDTANLILECSIRVLTALLEHINLHFDHLNLGHKPTLGCLADFLMRNLLIQAGSDLYITVRRENTSNLPF